MNVTLFTKTVFAYMQPNCWRLWLDRLPPGSSETLSIVGAPPVLGPAGERATERVLERRRKMKTIVELIHARDVAERACSRPGRSSKR
jgi:hypothetical protein